MAVLTSKLIVQLIDQISAPARGAAAAVRELQTMANRNAMQMNAMRGQMVDAAAAGLALARGLSQPVQQAMAFESAMADVAKVSDFSEAALNGFGKDLRRLATSEIPMAVTELAALSENAAASGIAGEDLLDFTRMTAKAALAWGVSGGQAGEDLAKIREALRLNIDETMTYADAINHLADNTASQAPDLVKFTRYVAAQGEFYGYSKEQTLAFGSAMISAGAETEVAATSFRNMGRALTKGAGATDRMKKAYQTLGLDATKVAKSMQEDAVGTTMEVIKRLGQLPKEMQASIMSDLFGDEARALAPLLGNLELVERTLGYVNDEAAYAGSVQAEFEKRLKTTEFSLQRLKNQVTDVAMSIGNALLPVIRTAADVFGPYLLAMSDWISANEEIVRTVIGIVAGIVALRVGVIAARWAFLFLKGAILDTALVAAKGVAGLLGLLNPLNLVKNAAMLARSALLFSGVGLVLAGIAMAGLWIFNNWEGLTAFFQGFGDAFMGAIQPIMPVLQPVVDAGQQLLDWVMGLVGPVDASREEWAGWGAVMGGAVAGGILAVVDGVKNIGKWITSTATNAGNLGEKLKAFSVSFVMEALPAFLEWIEGVAKSGLSLLASFAAPVVDGFLQWLRDAGLEGIAMALEFALGAIPQVLDWIWQIAKTGINLMAQFYLHAVPPILEWLWGIGSNLVLAATMSLHLLDDLLTWIINAVQNGVSFALNIQWPEPPGWLTWLMNEGAKLLGFGGDGGVVAGPGTPVKQYDEWDLPIPGKAVGGSIAGGQTYLVGEEGPELITPSRSGWVHTAGETAGMMGSRGAGGASISFGDIIIQAASDPEATARQVLAVLQGQLQDALDGIHADTEWS